MNRAGRPAFTLLEILLTIGLIALISGALVAGSASMLKDKPTSPDEVFWQVARQARKAALEGNVEVRVSFDDEHKAFVIDDGTAPQNVPIPSANSETGVDFIPAGAQDNALLGGVAVSTQKLPFAAFYPDGTCSDFQVQIRAKGGAHLIQVDPWTCAPELKAVRP